MKAAGRQLTKRFPNLIHVTCLAHGLSRVVLVAIDQYPLAKGLLSATKGILARSPQRKSMLRAACGRMLPSFVPTRWTSFLEALPVFIENFDKLKVFIKELRKDRHTSTDIDRVENLLYSDGTLREMHELNNRYGRLFVEAILELQKQDLPLDQALAIATGLSARLSSFSDEIGQTVFTKWQEVAQKNAGLELLHQLSSGARPPALLLKRLGISSIRQENIPYYMKATTVTADVERFFSKYNLSFSPLRQSATVSTMSNILTVQANMKIVNSMFYICSALHFANLNF